MTSLLSLFVGGSFFVLVKYYANLYREQDIAATFTQRPVDYSLPQIEIFDFIVVGGGAAGCTVASRLSEGGLFTVLLLEIGGNAPPQTRVPFFEFQSVPDITFQYKSVPQSHLGGRVLEFIVGRVMGGTTVHNTMYWNRPHPNSFERWVNLTGDKSWEYARVLKYFRRTETYLGEFKKTNQHGYKGPMPVTRATYSKGVDVWLKAGEELGYKFADPSGPQMISVSKIEVNRRKGRRVTSYDAFIKPNEGLRKNLKIIRYAHVEKVALNKGNQATGVFYKNHGVDHYVRARKEIILSAGTYGSPQILLRSGIGPADDLQKLKINVQLDRPGVGRHLIEHTAVTIEIFLNDSSQVPDYEKELTEESVIKFLKNGKGPLGAPMEGAFAQGWFASKYTKSAGFPTWPDIQLYPMIYTWKLPETMNLVHDMGQDSKVGILAKISLQRPKSFGTLTLDSSNITNSPIIDFKMLSHPDDVKTLLEGIREILRIFTTTKAYQSVGAQVPRILLPQCNPFKPNSDEYWLCIIRLNTTNSQHPVGTVRMGRPDESLSVVDSKLRVIGASRLRVADASIMPEIVNTNPQTTVYMIAEKVSEDIRNYWVNNKTKGQKKRKIKKGRESDQHLKSY